LPVDVVDLVVAADTGLPGRPESEMCVPLAAVSEFRC